MSAGAYVVGMAEVLAFVAAVVFSALRLRARFLPAWSGSPARLAEAILALSVVVCVSQLLGAVGLFLELPLLLAAGAIAVACARLPVPAQDPSADDPLRPALWPSPGAARAIACVAGIVVLAAWIPGTAQMVREGVWGFDSMWYHLPAAARFAETGSLTSLHLYAPVKVWWFLPANAELLHGVGISLLDRDLLSPLINLGWLGLALLAAWSIGRPYGAAAISVVAVSAVLLSPVLVVTQAGRAKPDIALLALLLAVAAILINGARASASRETGPFPAPPAAIVVAGLAAGLALGTRPNAIPLVVVISIGVIGLSRAGARGAAGLAWFAPMALTGSFWYLRNLFATGNPLPLVGVELGPISLPKTEHAIETFADHSIADRIRDGDVWSDYFFPGLDFAFSELWWLVLGMALAGAIGAAVAREAPIRGAIGAAALIGMIAHVFTPYTASGVGDEPTRFAPTLRYLIPVLALGLALAPTLPALRTPRGRLAVAGGSVAIAIALFATTDLLQDEDFDVVVLALLTAGALAALLAAHRALRLSLAASAIGVAVVAAAIYWPIGRDSLSDRYASAWASLDADASFRWANDVSDSRIGLSGTTAGYLQYGYYGRDLSNRVEYVGDADARGHFAPIESCVEWRAAVNAGDYDYLVTTATIDAEDLGTPGYAPERDWLGEDPAAALILQDGPTAVFRLEGQLDPEGCSQIEPLFEGLPPLLRQYRTTG